MMSDKGRPIRMKDLWNIPNGFTLSRLFLAIPLPFLIIYGEWYFAIAWLWAASITDWFDGKLARKFNQVTGIGEVLDLVVDRTLMIPGIISIIAAGLMPNDWFSFIAYMIFFLFVISGDLLVLGGLYIFARMKRRRPLLVYPSPPLSAKWLYAIQLLGLTLMISPIPDITVGVILIGMSAYNAYAANAFMNKAMWIFTGDVKKGMGKESDV